jgi:hypothetical protein
MQLGEKLEIVLDNAQYTGISVSTVELIWVFNGLDLIQDTIHSAAFTVSGVETFSIDPLLATIIFLG